MLLVRHSIVDLCMVYTFGHNNQQPADITNNVSSHGKFETFMVIDGFYVAPYIQNTCLLKCVILYLYLT